MILSIKKNCLYTGRAATAIYLVLRERIGAGSGVLFPVNICYAAVFPALYAGCRPVFCDVDPLSGNIDPDAFRKKLPDVQAAVIPHMYGNPVSDIGKIAEECAKQGVVLIEDCASAMGAVADGKPCGSYGDYAVFSTGYAKTIDIGGGGILLSDHSLDGIRALYGELPEITQQDEENEAFLSKLYRLIRNNPAQSLEHGIWKGMAEELRPVFLHRDPEREEKIGEALEKLPAIVKERREGAETYARLLADVSPVRPYTWNEGAVPWRFNLFVKKEIRKDLIAYLLENKVPVSDWYPSVAPAFETGTHYENAERMGEEILNFPLPMPQEEIEKICRILKEYR